MGPMHRVPRVGFLFFHHLCPLVRVGNFILQSLLREWVYHECR